MFARTRSIHGTPGYPGEQRKKLSSSMSNVPLLKPRASITSSFNNLEPQLDQAPPGTLKYNIAKAVEARRQGNKQHSKVYAEQARRMLAFIACGGAEERATESPGFTERRVLKVTWNQSNELLLLDDDMIVKKCSQRNAERRWIFNWLSCYGRITTNGLTINRKLCFAEAVYDFRAKSKQEVELKVAQFPATSQTAKWPGTKRDRKQYILEVNIAPIQNQAKAVHVDTPPNSPTGASRKVMMIGVPKTVKQSIIRTYFGRVGAAINSATLSATSQIDDTNTWYLQFFRPILTSDLVKVQLFKQYLRFPKSKYFTREALVKMTNAINKSTQSTPQSIKPISN